MPTQSFDDSPPVAQNDQAVPIHSDHKPAEAVRTDALELLQKITHCVPGMVFQFRLRRDGSSCFPYASDAISDILRLSPEDVREDASKAFAVVHPDDYDDLMLSIQVSARDLTAWRHEFRIRFDDGTVRWLFGDARPEREADGVVLWHGFITDATERKRAEAELQAGTNRLRALVDTVVDGIIVIDATGRIQTFNSAAQALFGYAPDEACGQNIKLLMPQPYAHEHDGYLHSFLSTGRKKVIGTGREVSGRRKDGSVFPMELAVSEMEINGERMFTGIVRDISARKENEAALIAAKEEAERASLAKSRFLSSMSHELRTPLNVVLGFAQLMQMDKALTPDHKESLGMILQAGHHLLELIEEVLNLARIESGNIELLMEPVDLGEVVKECMALTRPLADARGIQVECADAFHLVLRADRLRLKQVLLNLLSNAIKYNRLNGQVKLRCSIEDGRLARIAVSDTGPGIPQARLGELFQPFNRLGAEGGTIHGTGIGLAISRQLVELMGGEIGVESASGSGTTFWVDLPHERRQHAFASSESTVEAHAQCNVLYIDDNPSNLKRVSRLLGRRPHIRLTTAHTAQIGLELAAANRFELILLDINLPGMSGFEVLAQLRGRDMIRHTPVVALTASDTPRDIERGLAAGFTEYVTKPIDIERFFKVVDTWVPDAHRPRR